MQARPREAGSDDETHARKRPHAAQAPPLLRRLLAAIQSHDRSSSSLALTVRLSEQRTETLTYGNLAKCSAAVAEALASLSVLQVIDLASVSPSLMPSAGRMHRRVLRAIRVPPSGRHWCD